MTATPIEFPGFRISAGAERLRAFARAIGETDPLYSDPAAARAAGYRSLPLPPTFLFGLCLDPGEPFPWFARVGFELPRVLHAEQHFTYYRTPCADDILSVKSRVSEHFERRNGSLRFVVHDTRVLDAAGDDVADLRSIFVQPEHRPERRGGGQARPSPRCADCDRSTALRLPAIGRDTLQNFGVASGDLNPLHLDPDFARRAGFSDVIVPGMLPMAYLGRWLTARQPQSRLRRFGVRFLGVTQLGDVLCCRGTPAAGASPQELDLRVDSACGEARLRGSACFAAPCPPKPQ